LKIAKANQPTDKEISVTYNGTTVQMKIYSTPLDLMTKLKED